MTHTKFYENENQTNCMGFCIGLFCTIQNKRYDVVALINSIILLARFS